MNKSLNIVWIIAGILTVVSCQPSSDIDKLKEKRSKLKSELSDIENQLRALDTSKVEFLPLVFTGEVAIEQFIHEVTVQGEVRTDEEIMINAEASGVVTSINVREGQFVKQGQILAQIDTEILQSNLNELNTAIDFAQYAYDKQVALMERGVGTEFELKQAKNQLESLQSQKNTLITQKGKSVVRAPFDGHIDEVFVRKGEMAGAQSPILRLVNNSDMRLSANISEFYFTRIKEGTPVKAYIPTLSDTFNLKVTSIGNYIHPTNRTFRIQADVNRASNLLPNMLAELHITDQVIDSAIVVPATSLLKTQENEDFIYVVSKKQNDRIVEKVYVEVLSRHKGRAAINPISRSLKAGEIVATDGGRGITEGDRVRIQ